MPDPEDPVRWSFRIPCGTKIARSPRRWKAEFYLAEGFQTGWYVTLPKDFVGVFLPYSAPVIPCEVWRFRHQFSPRVKKGLEHKGHIFLGVDDVRFLGDVSIKTFKLPI